MPSEIQQNRYDQLIRRVGGIIGPGSKVAEALTELFPTIDVENVPGELLALMGTRLCFGGSLITAIAAQFAELQLFNPAGSGKIVTIESIYVASSASQQLRSNIENAALGAGIGVERFRDTRFGITPRPSTQIRTASSVAPPGSFGNYLLLANQTLKISDRNGVAVLIPGTGFNLGSTSTVTTLDFTINWRERSAEQSELNF